MLVVFQLRVKAYDPVTPNRAAFEDYEVAVRRNTNNPSFVPDPNNFVVTLFDDETIGKSVISVSATDADLEVVFILTF